MQEIQGVKIRPKDVAGYLFLPGIMPRLKELFGSGFGWIAYLMAMIYFTVRLLPAGHPYLDSHNIGRFGIHHVVAEAASHLVIKKENIDQILVFIILMAGFLILLVQIGFLVMMLLIEPVFAAGLFGTDYPEKDIAFVLLDQIFAIPGLFGSEYDPGSPAGIPPFNKGLQALFQFYSTALLLIGVLILLYFIMVVVGETATTGTPFGQRFNSVWAPIRLVVALGLLVPIHYGLNSAQYITLYAAKLGSGFATNAWLTFNQILVDEGGNILAAENFSTTESGDNGASMIVPPRTPDVTPLVQFMSLVNSCRALYESFYEDEIYFEGTSEETTGMKIKPYLVKNPLESREITAVGTPSWKDALEFYGNKDIIIRFGHDGKGSGSAHLYPWDKGGVKPYCGEIKVHTSLVGEDGQDSLTDGVRTLQSEYYNMIMTLWQAADSNNGISYMSDFVSSVLGLWSNTSTDITTSEMKNGLVNLIMQPWVQGVSSDAYTAAKEFGDAQTGIPDELKKRGWAGAGIWYNHVAQWNGALFDAVNHLPTPTLMPAVMKEVSSQRRKTNQGGDPADRYKPTLKEGKIDLESDDLKIAEALNEVYQGWVKNNTTRMPDEIKTGNIFIDLSNMLFGLDGLFSMKDNDSVHPLAQLTAIGKSIVDHAVNHLMTAMALSAGGGMMEAMKWQSFGGAATAMSGFFSSLTSIGLSVGFLLYYIVPFLPFMYFFFAVGSWVKTIFEAMVGTPLWALAHIRIDGTGLSGDGASNGYFLIFEIFIRPIMTVFGLLAGLIVFTAMARTLNGIFDLVTMNVAGYDPTTATDFERQFKQSAIDEFFFTIMYAVLIYIMAMASFKMIDAIPQGILRWMGAGVSSFADDRDDPAGNLMNYAAFGGASMAQKFSQNLVQGSRLAGQGVGQGMNALFGRNDTQKINLTGQGQGRGGGGGTNT